MTADEWQELICPYLDEARALGCAHIGESVAEFPDGVRTCTTTLLYHRETFVDLLGNLLGASQPPGVPAGLLGVTFQTWKSPPRELRRVFSHAAPDPAPAAPGLNAWLTRYVVFPVVQRLTPRDLRPFPLRGPADLRPAIERHYRFVHETPGDVRPPAGDPLEWREAWLVDQEPGPEETG